MAGKGAAYEAEIARRKAGSGRSVKLALTGFREIDDKLKLLQPKLVNKFARQSLRRSGKYSLAKTKEIINAETDGEGAYADSMTLRTLKQSAGQRRAFGHQVGMSIMPRQRDYFPAYEEAYGKLPNPSPKYNAEKPFYVPAALEFGWTDKGGRFHPPVMAQRRGLYATKDVAIANFRDDMKQLITEAGA